MARSSKKRTARKHNSSAAPHVRKGGKRREWVVISGVAGVGLVVYIPSTYVCQLAGGEVLRFGAAVALYIALLFFSSSLRRKQAWPKSMFYAFAIGGLVGAPGLGAGGVTWLNWGLDSAPYEQTTTILQMNSEPGRRVTYYTVELEPWAPLTEPVSVAVNRRNYDRLSHGREAIVLAGKGALGIPWVDNTAGMADVRPAL
jgi:hypothetical protein